MNKEYKPLYGIIAYSGSQYSVVMHKKDKKDGTSSTCTLTGYGQFPFEKYPELPVIDYTNNESVFDVLGWNLHIKESSIITSFDSLNLEKFVPLSEFLKRVYSIGIMIYNYAEVQN